MKNKLLFTLLIAAFTAPVAIGAPAQAPAKFPVRPVRIIVPYAPGGATDLVARPLATKLNEEWAQPVVVENKPGASGNIALEAAAKASPDGYTLLVGNVSTNAINETTFAKTLHIKPSRDLTGVTNLIQLPHLFVVNPKLPVSNLKQLVEQAKKSRLNYASAGVGSYPHLDMVVFLKRAGVDMTHVPYKGGAGQMIPAIMGNEVQCMEINVASALSNIRAGRIKAIATTWTSRLPELPDVPTVAEEGFPGLGTNAWNGLFAPAKVPKPLLARIHASVVKVMERPDMKELLAKQFMSVVVNKSPAEFNQFVQNEVKKWGKIVIDNQITVE